VLGAASAAILQGTWKNADIIASFSRSKSEQVGVADTFFVGLACEGIESNHVIG
jgi:hypothetical protein